MSTSLDLAGKFDFDLTFWTYNPLGSPRVARYRRAEHRGSSLQISVIVPLNSIRIRRRPSPLILSPFKKESRAAKIASGEGP